MKKDSKTSKFAVIRFVNKVYRGKIYNFLAFTFAIASLIFLAIPFDSLRQYWELIIVIEFFIGAFFTIDFVLNIRNTWQKTKKVWISIFSWVNLFSVLALAGSIVWMIELDPSSTSRLEDFNVLRLFRLALIVRPISILLDLGRYRFIRIIREKFESQRKWFAALMVFFCVVVVISALIIFVNEKDVNDKINDFGDAIYFTVITMTTIGYGDIGPVSQFTRGFVIFLSIISIVLVSLPSALVVNIFILIQEERGKIDALKKQVMEPKKNEVWHVEIEGKIVSAIIVSLKGDNIFVATLKDDRGEGSSYYQFSSTLLKEGSCYIHNESFEIVRRSQLFAIRFVLPIGIRYEFNQWLSTIKTESQEEYFTLLN